MCRRTCATSSQQGDLKQAIARQIGVHRTTVSDWLSGKAQPTPANIERLAEIFALPPDTNPAEEPIFSSWLPVSDVERRRWLDSGFGHLRALGPCARCSPLSSGC